MDTKKKSNRRGPFVFTRHGCSFPPVRTLLDMSEKEIEALECEYGCPVIRPVQKVKSQDKS